MCFLLGCGSSEDTAGPSDDTAETSEDTAAPVHEECKKSPASTVERITSTFVAPVKVVTAYQVRSKDTPEYLSVTVGTDGFPEGVAHKDQETPAPDYAIYRGKLYTASGQAMRYSGESIPNITDVDPLLTYMDATDLSFDCVKAEL
jgi:hypothetical protein